MMGKKERERLVVMARVKRKEITLREASEILSISYRQTKRIGQRYRKQGDKGLIHVSRGRPSNRKIDEKTRKKIIERYAKRYNGYGPTFTVEKLSMEGYQLSEETLRLWLIKEGLWERRRYRSKHRIRRQRKEHFGELVQMDGSHHQWFGEDQQEVCLQNMIDDASGRVFALFDDEETISIAMRTLWGWIERYGIPKAVYTDYKNVYVTDREPTVEEQLRGERPPTHFGKACKKLGIDIIRASSPQAKGRVERSNGTHQDRLVKELELKNIKEINKANEFLIDKYLDDMNRRFAVKPASQADYHRAVPEGLDLRTVFCIEQQRQVNNDWTVQYKNRYFQILKENKPLPRTREKVSVSQWLDGPIHLVYKGLELKCKELPSRPVKEASREVSKIKLRKKYIPPADHPWRRFTYGKTATAQATPAR